MKAARTKWHEALSLFTTLCALSCLAPIDVPARGEDSQTRLTGVVLDEKSVPVSTASVGMVATNAVRRYQARVPDAGLNTRVNRNGKYELLVPRELGTVRLVARAAGFAPARSAPVVLDAEQRVVAPLRFAAGIEVHGRVIDELGTSITGATVTVEPEATADDTLPVMLKAVRAKSESAGRFSVAGLERGSHRFVVEHTGFAPRTLRNYPVRDSRASRLVEIELFQATYLGGRVIDRANQPVANATLAGTAGPAATLKATSDAEGRFRLGPFARGANIELITSATGFGPARSDGIVAPASDLLVLLDRNGGFRGRVLDVGSREPLKAFQLSFHRRPGAPVRTSSFPGERTFQTEDGRFEWPDVYPGTWTITVQAPGHQPLEYPGLVIQQGELTPEILLLLEKGVSIRGRIYDRVTGLPVSGASIEQDRSRTPNLPSLAPRPKAAVTDQKGQFVLDGLPSGRTTVLVDAQGYADERREVTVDTRSFVEIGITRGAIVSGRLIAADGVTPVAGMINVSDPTTGTGGSIPTDEQGRFLLTRMSAGRYEISADSEQGRASERDIVLAENEQLADLTLILDAGADIRGVVSGLLPGERGRVRIQVSKDGTPVAFTEVSDQGSYVVHGLAPGDLEVSVHTALDRSMSQSLKLTNRNDTTVNFVFPEGVRLSGRVARAGKAVRYAVLNAKPLEGQTVSGSGETSQSGQYVIEGLDQGNYLVVASGLGRSARINLSGNTTLDFDLPSLALSGQAVDALDGKPLSAVSIEVKSALGSSSPIALRTESDDRGRFTVSGLDPGQYHLKAYKAEYDLVIQHGSLAATTSDLSIRLIPTRGVDIRARDAISGQPLRSIFVDVPVDGGAGYRLQIPLDENGVGRLPGSLVGRNIGISWFGYGRAAIPTWNGLPVDMLLTAERG